MPAREIRPLLTLAWIVATTLLFGCGEAGTGPAPRPTPSVATSVSITPRSAAFTALGDALDAVAEVADQRGAAMPNATVTWRSDDETVASVRATGDREARITAVGTGQANLVASVGAVSATVAVAVEQTPASLHPGGDDLRDRAPGTAVRVTAEVRDRNGHPAAGARVSFRVEAGGGTVDPESAVTGAEGRAETRWTLGASGAQALSATAGAVAAQVSATLCTALVLEPGLRLGAPRVPERSEIGCGVSVEAPEAGAYYRLTLVGTSDGPDRIDNVALTVEGGGASADAPPARRFHPAAPPPARAAAAGVHPGRFERDRQVLSWAGRPDGPRFLPDLRGTLSGPQPDPPEQRVFTWGRPGTVGDNCTVGRQTTGVLLAHNDDIAIYVADTLAVEVFAEPARLGADLYGRFGAPVIERYFGGVGDVDGDGRILVLVEDLEFRVNAFVWMGELLSREDCPASNQAELVRVEYSAFEPRVMFRIPGTLAHEAKHISSHHQLVRRAAEGGKGHFDVRHPLWVEEGTAEIAAEVAARLGWESIGGPPPGAMVEASDLRYRAVGHVGAPEAYGVSSVLFKYGWVILHQPNSLTAHDPYGAGWGFMRFVGDWFGGAGGSRLGDADLFAELNDAATPVGLDGLHQVTGRDFGELMIDYAQAVSLAGTGAPDVPGVPRFATYDMSALTGGPFPARLAEGRFPYPVTRTGSGPGVPIWVPLAESTAIAGPIGPNGFRVHDFRAEAAGDKAVFRIWAPEHVRLVVTRIPDQKER